MKDAGLVATVLAIIWLGIALAAIGLLLRLTWEAVRDIHAIWRGWYDNEVQLRRRFVEEEARRFGGKVTWELE